MNLSTAFNLMCVGKPVLMHLQDSNPLRTKQLCAEKILDLLVYIIFAYRLT